MDGSGPGGEETNDGAAPDRWTVPFDEDFVRAAPVDEPSAVERAALERLRPPHDELAERRRQRHRPRRRRRAGRSRATRPSADAGGAHPRARRLKPYLPAALLVALVLGAAWVQRPGEHAVGFGAGGQLLIHVGTGEPKPTPSPAESDEPLGHPGIAPAGGPHEFMATQSDGTTPVTYDPCRTIRVVVNPRTAPTGWEQLVRESLQEMTSLTGLQFEIEGVTSEIPDADRASFQPERYGDRWAPVLIAWSDEEEVPELAGEIAGIGGSSISRVGLRDPFDVYVTGIVALDGESFARMMGASNGWELARSVMLHELGHLVGLAHTDGERQLMDARPTREVRTFQHGDLAGLAQLGQGACVPEL